LNLVVAQKSIQKWMDFMSYNLIQYLICEQ
jgi:hypothetical protein